LVLFIYFQGNLTTSFGAIEVEGVHMLEESTPSSTLQTSDLINFHVKEKSGD
jgi:hypothetical protein